MAMDLASSNPFAAPASAMQSPPPSSPARPTRSVVTKPKKPPPITPKRFTKFFTPRTTSTSTKTSGLSGSRAGRQLRDITRNAINRRAQKTQHDKTPRKTVLFADDVVQNDENNTILHSHSPRKRKAPPTPPESSPIQSSPTKRLRPHPTPSKFEIRQDEITDLDFSSSPPQYEPVEPPARILRLRGNATTGRLLERSFGGLHIGRGRKWDHCASDWRHHTANYCSTPNDVHSFRDTPFCVTSCNSNSLVAVGGEDGSIRLLESDPGIQDFSKTHVKFEAHKNAIMDMAFSPDDLFLATASGDQTTRVIDIHTQSSIAILAGHQSSVKQVRFQPGTDKVLATSGRDGCVHIWDLRCRGYNHRQRDCLGAMQSGSLINSIDEAHSSRNSPLATQATSRDLAAKGEPPGFRGDVSVTSMAFLPTGRENFLLTASDASSVVKLWDIRARYSRRGPPVAISATQEPESHSKHRSYGISSLNLSGDSSRFYALSRDNTIYAYSTNHLILGNADLSSATRARPASIERPGVSPLYGLRHPNFFATSFYVKASVRPASGEKPEMLAVGGSSGKPTLFPTDEAILHNHAQPDVSDRMNGPRGDSTAITVSSSHPSLRPSIVRTTSFFMRAKDTIPTYSQATALTGGHNAEVTSVSWSHDGALVTVGDDKRARRWVEDTARARDLRTGGEDEGRRWMCGWARVSADWDDDE